MTLQMVLKHLLHCHNQQQHLRRMQARQRQIVQSARCLQMRMLAALRMQVVVVGAARPTRSLVVQKQQAQMLQTVV